MLMLPERSYSTLDYIHCVDALSLLRALPDKSVDMLLLDPPYAVHEAAWDKPFDIAAHFKEWRRVIKDRRAIVITCVMSLAWQLIACCPEWFKYDMVIIKNNSTDFLNSKNKPMRRHENILVFSNGTTANGSLNRMPYFPQMKVGQERSNYYPAGSRNNIFGSSGRAWEQRDYQRISCERYPDTVIQPKSQNIGGHQHPNQKDIDLFETLIQTYTRPGELVLDPFSGSGTTAIAARKTGRHFICGDSSAEYVEMSRKRLATTDPYLDRPLPDGRKQLSMFAGVMA